MAVKDSWTIASTCRRGRVLCIWPSGLAVVVAGSGACPDAFSTRRCSAWGCLLRNDVRPVVQFLLAVNHHQIANLHGTVSKNRVGTLGKIHVNEHGIHM